MDSDILVKHVRIDCPICDQNHEVELHRRIATMEIRHISFSYPETYFKCPNTGKEECEFQTGGMVQQNITNARNAYQQKRQNQKGSTQ